MQKNHRLGLKTLVNCSFRWLYFQLNSNFYILRRGIPLSNNWPQIPNLIDAGTLENRQKPAKIEGNPNCGSPATETATVYRVGCLYNSVRDYWTVKILGGIREMAALSQARKCIKWVHLVAETAMPIIYLVEIFIIRKVNKSIGPGK